ncbi:MAG: signal peptidase I [Isosphaeraceae bacterium]
MGRTAAIPQTTPAPRKGTGAEKAAPAEGHRDTVEAVVVALILALVVRGFEAQAFVIPTGSMAPTLMGRHKELSCPQCGFTYSVNASMEVEPRSALRDVRSGICVNCRYQARGLTKLPSFKGDRILVMMFPYDLPFLPGASNPERWDVVVFRYPEEPEISYIKRLVGLPGETIRIRNGDIFVRPRDGEGFRLQRKPLEHQAAMQMYVHDDRFRPRALDGQEEWRRWRSGSADGWQAPDQKASLYRCDASASDGWAELRYHHLVPDPQQWDAILNDRPLPHAPRSTLITDFYSYNTNLTFDDAGVGEEMRSDSENPWLQPHWVGDLTLSAAVRVESDKGILRFELIEGGVPHRCEIDVSTGKARFLRGEDVLLEFATSVAGAGSYQVDFANVDNRLTLWVNGRPVAGDGVEFDPGDRVVPLAEDLAPAAVAVSKGTVTVSDLVLKRDIYYTQNPGRVDYRDSVWSDGEVRNPTELFDFLADPSRFARLGRGGTKEYRLGEDRFLMLGDNSPFSKDSRGWDSSDSWDTSDRKPYEVQRSLLTGKAFYIYWPHGVPFGPESISLGRDTRLIFRPYVERMKWIR